MDLTSPHAFWLIRNGVGEVRPPLGGNRRCDVLVIGAGLTGALLADALTARGQSVIVIDRRHPGHGSTSASTALLQYELDAQLVDLIDTLGRKRAVAAYRACLDGVRALERTARGLSAEIGFRRRPSLYYTSRSREVIDLRKEAVERARARLPCELLTRKEVAELADIPARAALWSNVGGEMDPWRMTQALLDRCATRDFAAYGRTHASRITTHKTHLEVHTDRGRIRARNVVVAAGYEAERFLPERVATLQSTYAIVTEPVSKFEGWGQRCLVWESSRPYLYARTTSDNRIIAGGEDESFRNPALRDSLVEAKAAKLMKKLRRLFPRIEMELAYAWAGTFGETKDTLPYVGTHPGRDNRIYYALGYGANGMPVSAVAAEIVTAGILGERHRHRNTFPFGR